MPKTLYIWDLANTVLPEKWDEWKSGARNYDEYLEGLGFDMKTIPPRDYELNYSPIYRRGFYVVDLAKGFVEVLGWTKNNLAFTTGLREGLDTRAEIIKEKYGIDPRDYIHEVISTFDFAESNVKTEAMLQALLKKKLTEGYETVVYTDDSEKNCKFFLSAVNHLIEEGVDLKARIYRFKNDDSDFKRLKENFFQIGNLNQLKANEEQYDH